MRFRYECGHVEQESVDCEICALRAEVAKWKAGFDKMAADEDDSQKQLAKLTKRFDRYTTVGCSCDHDNVEPGDCYGCRGHMNGILDIEIEEVEAENAALRLEVKENKHPWVCLVHGYKALPVCGLCVSPENTVPFSVLNDHGRHWEAIADALGIPCLGGVDCDPETTLSNAALCVEKVLRIRERLSALEKAANAVSLSDASLSNPYSAVIGRNELNDLRSILKLDP